ncbi:MAG: Protease 4 [Flavobacteriaceae bacterium]|jgi:protease-4|nr:signal peptide peptidase SppA [Flavobacteriaceae bacterium]CAI8185101.1 MAG: Protease 4 [Flavobacteriaceae bacterium]
MNFFKRFIASFFAVIAAFWFMGIVLVLIIAGLGNADVAPSVANASVLKIALNRPIVDYKGGSGDDPFSVLFEETIALDEVVASVQAAAEDDRISGISFETPFFLGGWSQAETLRNALLEFKNSGKFIYAYGDSYSQKSFYLSSVADSLFVTPTGFVDLRGLSSELTYYKSFQEKSGLRMEVIRHGKYKAAVEPYLNDAPSKENVEQIQELIDSLWDEVGAQMADQIEVSRADFEGWVNDLVTRDLEKAKELDLIGGLIYEDQYEDTLKRAVGASKNDLSASSKLNEISSSSYFKTIKSTPIDSSDRIALVYAQGSILYGEGSPTIMGQETMNKALQSAREDRNIKAVVLRINSPGGSALTSDLIWREVEKTAKEKPVVVSISDVAASGGYYIATPATYIIAQSTSITGSIGVFGTLPNASELAEQWGVSSYTLSTHERSATYSPLRPLSDSFRAELTEGIEQTYQTFLERVASGRSMSIESVDAIAQGRVYLAPKALELGLIDEIGTLEDAINKAAELAAIDEFRLREYPRYKSDLERLLGDLPSASLSMISSKLPSIVSNYLNFWETVGGENHDYNRIQARLPFDLEIE